MFGSVFSLWRNSMGEEKVSKASVNYREATGTRRCDNCGMYHKVSARVGSCDLVRGVIEAADTCDKWVKKS